MPNSQTTPTEREIAYILLTVHSPAPPDRVLKVIGRSKKGQTPKEKATHLES